MVGRVGRAGKMGAKVEERVREVARAGKDAQVGGKEERGLALEATAASPPWVVVGSRHPRGLQAAPPSSPNQRAAPRREVALRGFVTRRATVIVRSDRSTCIFVNYMFVQ